MKPRSFTRTLTAIALGLLLSGSSAIAASPNPKASNAQNNANKPTTPATSSTNSPANNSNQSNSQSSPGNSSANNSPSKTPNSSATPSQSNSGNSGSTQTLAANNATPASPANSPAVANNSNSTSTKNLPEVATAKAPISNNPKLNPASVSTARINSRADKVTNVLSKTSAACQTFTAAQKARVATDPCSDFIVVFQPGLSRAQSNNLIAMHNGQVKREFNSIFNGALVNGPLSRMQALANNPNVLVVEDDYTVTATAVQNSAPWGLDRIDQNSLPLTTTFDDGDLQGANSYAFVVDTGIDASNVEFEGRIASGFTAITDGNGSADCNGHGTHVAGIIGSKQFGVAKKTNLIPVRVLDCSGSGTYSSVISGLDWIAANYRTGDAAVVNMSLGGPASSTLDGAVKNLIAKGVNVVVAAGNSSDDACNYSPARVPDAITVGATASSDYRAIYSNFGSCLDLFAPGSSITSTWLGTNGVNTISGTSMASPHVTGVVARFISTNPTLTPQQVANSIRNSATKDVVQSTGTNSPNLLSYLNIIADTTSPAPADSTPTYRKVNPRGKLVGR